MIAGSAHRALLEVRDLSVSYGDNVVVDKLNFAMHAREALSLAGESGSGKSQTALAIMGLLPPNAKVSGEVLFEGRNLVGAGNALLNEYRARRMAMIFQDPLAALNPYISIGQQLRRILIDHGLADPREASRRALDMLKRVGLPDAERQYRAYPHELSGGMRQRALIASALIAEPELLIADEPTTALDVTVQAQILEVLDRLRARRGMAVLLITHDLGIVAGRADRVAVMYAGQIVEEAPTARLFARPSHPYTQGLFASVPRITGPLKRLNPIRGSVPSPAAWPAGCRFRPRCPQAFDKSELEPPLLPLEPDHRMRCWLAEEPNKSSHR